MSFEQSKAKQPASTDLDAPVQLKADPAQEPSFQRQSLGEIGSVQETARGGVAGGGGALPHLEAIQRSFGRHDVSGVSAHVGGAAADASSALGAQAYATGNNVAFASQPDLHTAAHEAAHTVQQGAGAVSFKGVDSPGDQHEVEADRVADAVVAGESAEPMLDAMVGDRSPGSSASSGAVQRKKTDEPKEQLTAADQVIYTNIVAAQNELDELVKYLEKAKQADIEQIKTKLGRASLYLMEAVETMPQSSASSSKIAGALASLLAVETRVDNFIHLKAVGDPPEDNAAYEDLRTGLLARFLEREGKLMRKFGVPSKPDHKSTVGRLKDEQKPEVEAVKASLNLAAIEAQRGYELLINHTGDFQARVEIVRNTSNLAYSHIGHATAMTSSGFDEKQKAQLVPATEAVSKPLLLMKRWMDKRQGNAKMVSSFANLLLAINGTRANLGLNALELNPASDFPEREEAEETLEKGAMDSAVGKFAEAWESLSAAMEEGVEQWYELAKKGDQKKPSFGQALLSALITAAAGNLLGVIAKGMITVADDDVIKQAIQDMASGIASDASQSIAGPAINEGIAKAGEDPSLKALLFVRTGLKAMCRNLKSTNVSKLHDNVAKGKYSIAQVQGMEKCTRKTEGAAVEKLKVQSATDWVRYVAQSTLGKKVEGGENSVSNEVTDLGDQYYGEVVDGGARIGKNRIGNKQGTAGMLRVEVRDNKDWDFARESRGKLYIEKIDVNGLNPEMAKLILQDAKTLDDVKVPKEVHIEHLVDISRGRSNTHVRPYVRMAINENGVIKHTHSDEHAPDNAASSWELIRKLPINPGLAE